MSTQRTKIMSDGGVWNARLCGAVGDGHALDMKVLQAAIDDCHNQGGGRVLLPPGVYRTGTLLLKSDVDLHLAKGATLLGSADRADYHPEHFSFYTKGLSDIGGYKKTIMANLVAAVKARRISITGHGTIDGNGSAFFGAPSENSPLKRFRLPGTRPSHMLAFYECEDVLVENVRLLNTPFWTVWPYGCRRLRFQGLTIYNHPSTPNGDGINPDCCQDVIIQNCLIETGDDCIALKSCGLPIGDQRSQQACENIIVSDCILKSQTSGIRLGVEGDNPIQGVNLNNLVIQGRCGIVIQSLPYLPEKSYVLYGTPIEDVQISQVIMRNLTGSPFLVHMCQEPGSKDVGISRLAIHQVQATSAQASVFYGRPDRPINALTLRDVYLKVKGAFTQEPYPGAVPPMQSLGAGRERIPYALYGRYLKDVLLSGMIFDRENISGPWIGAYRMDDTRNIKWENTYSDWPQANQ